jgi:hypothetical protein
VPTKCSTLPPSVGETEVTLSSPTDNCSVFLSKMKKVGAPITKYTPLEECKKEIHMEGSLILFKNFMDDFSLSKKLVF